MLVLKEDSLPYYIDPHSLGTLGRWDFHGKWTATSMSAPHPKIDPLTGEMMAYCYQAKGIGLAFQRAQPSARLAHLAPRPSVQDATAASRHSRGRLQKDRQGAGRSLENRPAA